MQGGTRIGGYPKKVEWELSSVCSDITVVLGEHVIPSASDGESKVSYSQMKGDYYPYVAEFNTSHQKEERLQNVYCSSGAALDVPILGLAVSIFFTMRSSTQLKGI
ncbi:hypothetical protein NL676_016137 [Syzygium grande]|nr:hypothetical protein NL676_016137 [Syzygium grande]